MADSLIHGWDLLIVAAYMAICLLIGLFRSNRIKNLKQFALGYKNISTSILVCIIFASNIGGGTLLGTAEKLSLFGLAFIIGRLFLPIGWLITTRIYGPNIEQFKDCISVSQIMHKLYGSFGRWVTTIAAVIMGIGILVAQAVAIGYVFNYFFGIEAIYGVMIGFGILTLYTALGGIRSVVITEVFQFSIFLLIIPVSYIITLMDIGGMPNLIRESSLVDWDFNFTTENTMLIASFVFFSITPECYSPFIQRCLMATSAVQLRRSLTTVSLMSLPLALSLFLIAYIVKLHSPDVPDSEAFVFYISNYLPVGIKGLMVAGTIAVIMGLAEAWLNATSVIIVNDIVKILFPYISDRKQLVALRISVVLLSVIAVTIAHFSNNVIHVILLVDNLWIPLVLVPLVSGFLGFRTSSRSFLTSVVMALIFTIVSKLLTGGFSVMSLCLGIIGSAIGLFGTHYWQVINTPTIKQSINSLLYTQILKARSVVLLLKNLASTVYKKIKNTTMPRETPYHRFAIFTLAYYFAYTFSLTSDPTHRIFSYLLIVGYAMCFVLLLRDVIFSKNFQKKYLPLYWYATLTFCLPSVASYMLFASQGNDFWIINGLLSAFSLYFFVDAIVFILLLSLGIFFGYGLYLLNEPVHQVLDTHNTIEHIGYIYLFFLFAYLTLFRSREKEHSDKIGQMHVLSGAIAHEVKTPFASMVMFTQFINEILGKTINRVRKNDADEYTITLKKHEYEFLKDANQSVKQVGAQGINTINSILKSLKSSVVGDEKSVYSIEECLKKAINEYALINAKAKEIEVKIEDNFNVLCSLEYLAQVFVNLLKNAYKHGGRDVKIKIWTEGSKLYFKDNGKGIPKEDLPYIFDRYYTKSKTGTGIGLAFCKMVMEDLGGDIECESELGKHTTFVLIFPNSLVL